MHTTRQRPADREPEQFAAAWACTRQRLSLWPAASVYVLDNGVNTNRRYATGRFLPTPRVRMDALQAEAERIYSPTTRPTPTRTTCLRQTARQVALRPESGRQHQHHECPERHCGIHDHQPVPAQSNFRHNGGRQRARAPVRSAFLKIHPISSSTRRTSTVQRSLDSRLTKTHGNLTPLSQATKAKDSYPLPGPGDLVCCHRAYKLMACVDACGRERPCRPFPVRLQRL